MLGGQKKVTLHIHTHTHTLVILWNTDTLIIVTLKVLISNYTRRGPCHVEKEVNFSKIKYIVIFIFLGYRIESLDVCCPAFIHCWISDP